MHSTLLTFAVFCSVTLGIVAVGAGGREVCVARAPDTAGQHVGYELIDILRREAWVTTDWTVEDYAEFSPGIAAPNWLKNDPRQGFAARTAFLRSPGCPADGEFTFDTLFGRTFVHVADLTSLKGNDLTNGALTEASVNKHHKLEFDAGQIVSFLVSPEGGGFVRVNGPINARHGVQDPPDGWGLQDVALAAPWHIDLIGDVAVLRLENGVSYQGPVGEMPPGAVKDTSETPERVDN